MPTIAQRMAAACAAKWMGRNRNGIFGIVRGNCGAIGAAFSIPRGMQPHHSIEAGGGPSGQRVRNPRCWVAISATFPPRNYARFTRRARSSGTDYAGDPAQKAFSLDIKLYY